MAGADMIDFSISRFIITGFDRAPALMTIIYVVFFFFILSFLPGFEPVLLRLSRFKTTLAARKFLGLIFIELAALLVSWYLDSSIMFIGLRVYPFTFMILAVTVISGVWSGFVSYIFTAVLVTYYLIYPRYHYFPVIYHSIVVNSLLELLVGFVCGCVVRRYQNRLVSRLVNLRHELKITTLEKIAMQSEERALMRAIDTSSQVVTSSELSLSSILSTSQHWLSNVLKIVCEESRHLLNGMYAGVGFIERDKFGIVTIVRDKKIPEDKADLALLLLRDVLQSNWTFDRQVTVIDLTLKRKMPNALKNLGFTKILVAPIISKQKVIGSLFITNKNDAKFSEYDKRRLQLFASYAGLSIVNMHHYEKLSGLVEGRDQLLSMVSHELKTPLSTIKLYAQLMQQQIGSGKNTAELGFGLTTIDKEVDKLTLLVNSIHDFSRIKSGIFEIEKKPVYLNGLCKDTVTIVKQLFPDHEFVLQLPKAKIKTVVDKLRLEQVVANLLTNAAKYSRPNSKIVLSVKKTKPDFVTISVTDEGFGIAALDQAHIFEPFYQAKIGQTNAKGKGLGLGLYIANEIIARHNGTLKVNSVLGKGSTFSITLPLTRVKERRILRQPLIAGVHKLPGFALGRQHLPDQRRPEPVS